MPQEAGDILLGKAGDAAKNGPVGGVSLDHLADDRHADAGKYLRPVLDEEVHPEFGHRAVDLVQVHIRDGNPLRLARRARSRRIHHRLAREEDILFAVFMALHVRTEVLII